MEKELVYDLMNGYYNRESVVLPLHVDIEDEFEKGKKCDVLLDRVYRARMHLAKKLGHQEDEDVETIIDCMNEITKILCMKMYDYGKNYFFGQ